MFKFWTGRCFLSPSFAFEVCGLMGESLFFVSRQYPLVCSDVILLFFYKTLYRRPCASISEIKQSATFRQVFLHMCICHCFLNCLLQWLLLFFKSYLLYSLSSNLLISPSFFSFCEHYFSDLTLMHSSWCFFIAFLLLAFASISEGLHNACASTVL